MKRIWLVLFLFVLSSSSIASNLEGTRTYKDYIFVLVHGINADEGIFEGKYAYGNLKNNLENNLGLTGRVFYYTFSNPDGSNINSAKEFGYSENSKVGSRCWLEKARDQFIINNPGSPIPSKYIVITHSMGNMSVRSYIYSDYLSKHYKRPSRQGDHLEPVFDRGFYNDDVEEIITIDSQHLGRTGNSEQWTVVSG